MPELMTIEELERYLRFTRKTIYRFCKDGSIPAIKIGRKWRFAKEAIDEWLHHGVDRSKKGILVIDDDEFILSVFKETLEEEGHTVITADNGQKGLAHVMEQDFDLIFLDLKMPGADGAEILRNIRAVKENLPVIIITGYPDSEIMENAIKQGPIGLMKKPFDNADILNAVNSFLKVK
jgi:excisionase family DNA binding protein